MCGDCTSCGVAFVECKLADDPCCNYCDHFWETPNGDWVGWERQPWPAFWRNRDLGDENDRPRTD